MDDLPNIMYKYGKYCGKYNFATDNNKKYIYDDKINFYKNKLI